MNVIYNLLDNYIVDLTIYYENFDKGFRNTPEDEQFLRALGLLTLVLNLDQSFTYMHKNGQRFDWKLFNEREKHVMPLNKLYSISHFIFIF